MAGSGIRGQFEEKFKALIRDIEDESGNVICFIDEVREYQLSYSLHRFIHTHIIYVIQILCSISAKLKVALTQDR